ncbi:FGGY carbohydrate kinase pentulose kinase [Trinorchestia longiramus]|nr:FGGY carbohydrate kinase pentulose kinase [Trinorchestia longiramus]
MGVPVYIGVDVGTGSVRAACVSADGCLLHHHSVSITVHNPSEHFYEQDSGEIWTAVCQSVQKVCSALSADQQVAGIGFDATCSLVVLDEHALPLTVDPHTGEAKWNVVMWMDHRAAEEANLINSKPHSVLQYVGGKVSLEMQTPKLLWLKQHLPRTWAKAAHFFDLPDFLTFKATNSVTRSLCSLVCKWTYTHDGSKQGWDESFLRDVGLEDLTQNNFEKIGREVLPPGSVCGRVTAEAALQLGVPQGCPVGSSLIDAHAGALSLVSSSQRGYTGILAIISGTSSCHLVCGDARYDTQGVWGPYYSALLPGSWLAEAGQSATGALCDHVLSTHPAVDTTLPKNKLPEWVEGLVYETAKTRGLEDPTTLTKSLHVYPDHHGNRSPLADPSMTGMVCGLTLSVSKVDLALSYLATLQALAYGTRAIIEQLRSSGHSIRGVMLCGGLAQSQLFRQTHADVLGVEVVVPQQQQLSVVRGAAILGAAAAAGGDLTATLKEFSSGTCTVTAPRAELRRFHDLNTQPPRAPYSDSDASTQPPRAPYSDPDASTQPPRAPYSDPDASTQPPRAPYSDPDASTQPPRVPYTDPDASSQPPRVLYTGPDASTQS